MVLLNTEGQAIKDEGPLSGGVFVATVLPSTVVFPDTAVAVAVAAATADVDAAAVSCSLLAATDWQKQAAMRAAFPRHHGPLASGTVSRTL